MRLEKTRKGIYSRMSEDFRMHLEAVFKTLNLREENVLSRGSLGVAGSLLCAGIVLVIYAALCRELAVEGN